MNINSMQSNIETISYFNSKAIINVIILVVLLLQKGGFLRYEKLRS